MFWYKLCVNGAACRVTQRIMSMQLTTMKGCSIEDHILELSLGKINSIKET